MVTYIHSPFVFATANSHKTQNCISLTDWDSLAKQTSMFHNPLPYFDLFLYSIHADREIHIIFKNSSNSNALLAAVCLSVKKHLYP
jgi:hypothetical protein